MVGNDPQQHRSREPWFSPEEVRKMSDTADGVVANPLKLGFTPTIETASKLGEDLITHWVASGGEPRVPANRRDEVVATLTMAMVNSGICEAFRGSLEANTREHSNRPPIKGYGDPEMPVNQIQAEGFSRLDEQALGDIATNGPAVYAIRRVIDTPGDDYVELGSWYYAAISAADASTPGDLTKKEG